MNRILSILIAAVLGLTGGVSSAAELLAGVGVADITPDTEKHHVPLGGYGARMNAPALGVHDSTLAKALILKQGDKKYALVCIDFLGIPRSLRDEVLARIQDTEISSDTLMLLASHSHASLEMAAVNRKNVFNNKAIGIFDEALLVFTADRIAEAIQKANRSFAPVRAGAGSIEAPGLNRNRRGDGITDNDMTILRLDKMDGAPWVVFVNYTAHPTYMSERVMHVSAGWPGYLQRNIEGFMGEGVVCMYANGAEGDVSPNGGQGPSEFARAEDYGRKLAKIALELIPRIETRPEVELRYSMAELKLPPRTAPPALLDSAGPEYGLDASNIMTVIEALAPESSYVGALKIGDFCAVSIPGEMTTVLGLEIKEALRKAGAKYPIIAGLGNEWISYILPAEEFQQGGYEPGVSFYGDQLGPVVVAQAIEAGEKLLKEGGR